VGQQLAKPQLFQNLLAITTITQVVIAQQYINLVIRAVIDGLLGARRQLDIFSTAAGEHGTHRQAEAIEVIHDQIAQFTEGSGA
jgi:hypothetical protein